MASCAPAVLRFPSMTRQYSLSVNVGSVRCTATKRLLNARHDCVLLCAPSVEGELLLDRRLRNAIVSSRRREGPRGDERTCKACPVGLLGTISGWYEDMTGSFEEGRV